MVSAGTPTGACVLIMALLELKNLHVALEEDRKSVV